MKLLKFEKLTGKIELMTGLHIGGSQEATQIGGLDSPVIRMQKDNMPYIPGSSLKGKMRSLLELKYGKMESDGKVHRYKGGACDNEPCPICYLFGAAAGEGAPIGPARLIIRDCTVDKSNTSVHNMIEESQGLPLSEEKTEVSINRITSTAQNGALRKTERVPAGVVFDLDITVRVFDTDEKEKLLKNILLSLALVQSDTLGGSGSRGYGKIAFKDLKLDGVDLTLPEV